MEMSRRTADTEEERWAASFQGPNNEPYLFVKEVPGGSESSVQLLIHQQSSKIIVRKVPHSRDLSKVNIDLVTAAHIDKFGEGNEIQMVKYLAGFANNDASARIYQLLDCRTIEVSRGWPPETDLIRAPGSGNFLRETFWEYYNVGNLDNLIEIYQESLRYPPPSLVARIVHQTLAGLQFMLSSGRGVQHDDFHFGNIFAHWNATKYLPDVFIADFGDAKFVGKDSSDRTLIMRDMLLTDATVFASFLSSSWFCPRSVASDARFAALVKRLEQVRLKDLPAVIQMARLLEGACLYEEGEDEVVSYFDLFEAHQARNPLVAKTWSSKALAERETRDLPGPFVLIRL